MKIKYYIYILIIIFSWSCNNQTITEEIKSEISESKESYKIIGYVAGWKGLDISKIDAKKLTHINYAFANIIDGEVQFGNKEDIIDNNILNENDIAELNKLKEINPNLKILISIGGWTWSKNFSDVALTDESRKKFAKSAVDFLIKHKIDGIDIDWEYPNQIGAGNTYREEDIENFTLLLKELREQLDKQSQQDKLSEDKYYLLTIATGADKTYLDNTEIGEAHKYLDFINIMTYDYYNGLHYQTGHHSNFELAEDDPLKNPNSIIQSLKYHLDAEVPANKICLGIPFYGRKWENVSDNNNGLFQKAETVGSIINYKTIANEILKDNNYIRIWDSSAYAPYLWDKTQRTFISYEDTISLKHKLEFVKKEKYGGVMFWEYSNDNNQELLNVIYNNLNSHDK